MTFRPTDDEIARMLRARGSPDVPQDLRDAIAVAIMAEPRRLRVRSALHRPGLLLAATIALASVAGAAALLGPGLQPVPRQPPAHVVPSVVSVTPTHSAISSPADSTAVPFADWRPSAIDSDNATRGATIKDVASFQDRYVAIGLESSDSTYTDADGVVWTSADGAAWRLANEDLDLRGFWPSSVAANDQGIVLAGVYRGERGSEGSATLVSRDARDWTRASTDAKWIVAALPDRFVAVTSGPNATIWISSDGIAWNQMADLGPAWIERLRIVQTADGLLVAALGGQVEAWGAGTMWTASERRLDDWRRIDLEEGGYEWMRDVAATDDGLLAVAMRGYCCAVHAWASKDGLAWDSLGDPVGERAIQPESVAPTPSGFFVAGIQHSGDEVSGTLRAWLVAGEWLFRHTGWQSLPTDALGLGERHFDRVVVAPRADGAVIVMTTVDVGEGQRPVPLAWVVQ